MLSISETTRRRKAKLLFQAFLLRADKVLPNVQDDRHIYLIGSNLKLLGFLTEKTGEAFSIIFRFKKLLRF